MYHLGFGQSSGPSTRLNLNYVFLTLKSLFAIYTYPDVFAFLPRMRVDLLGTAVDAAVLGLLSPLEASAGPAGADAG